MAKKILLVDDAAFMRKMIGDTLSKNGYTELFEAVDGADAVEKFSEIRAKDGNANVVMCSAMGQESMVMDAVRSGAKDFIVKPFKADRVLKTVTSILGNP